jgi:crotonobetainyl-CoA:carnitine CoA-transferase CaiB-like acyl-CoA transferase
MLSCGPRAARTPRSAESQLPGQATGTGRFVREHGRCPAPVRVLHGAFDEPNILNSRRGTRWPEVDSPVGPLRALLPPITLPGGTEVRMGAVPALGEHTDALLRALGTTDAEAAELRRDGVIV